MSAYVSRLLDRFSPSVMDGAQTRAEPFVRSHSPLAEFDQRPAGEDGIGLDESTPFDDPVSDQVPAAAATPTRIRRMPLDSTPSTRASTSVSPAAPFGQSAVDPAPSPAAGPHPRREPLDPGPLFDILPRYFDAGEREPAQAGPPIDPSPSDPSPSLASEPHPRTLATPRPLDGRRRPDLPPSLAPSSPAAVTLEQPSVADEPVWLPSQPAVERERELHGRTIDPVRIPPWQPVEEHEPRPDIRLPIPPTRPAEPKLTPTPAAFAEAEERESSAARPRHYAAPRTSTPTRYEPDPGPLRQAAPAESARPRVHIGRVEVEIIASPAPAQSGVTAPTQKLSIDSISKIGPLGRHFSSRRYLRLRYR